MGDFAAKKLKKGAEAPFFFLAIYARAFNSSIARSSKCSEEQQKVSRVYDAVVVQISRTAVNEFT